MEEYEETLSDVHVDDLTAPTSLSSLKPSQNNYKVHQTTFYFTVTSQEEDNTGKVEVDEDGDLVVKRRKTSHDNVTHSIIIEHTLSTRLPDVGLQVWSGSLLLGDYILSKLQDWKGSTCLELGAGVGLCSILLSKWSPANVIATDVGRDVLQTCKSNAEVRRKSSVNLTQNKQANSSISNTDVLVRELDWTSETLSTDGEFGWEEKDIEILNSLDYILAADVIYKDSLTDAFLKAIQRICEKSKKEVKILLSIEKRMNFTLCDLDVASPAYDYFMKLVQEMESNVETQGKYTQYSYHQIENIPQYFTYKRNKYLELWEITASPMADKAKT